MNEENEKTELWDYLTESMIATEEELQLVTTINGHNLEALESVLCARTTYRSLEQVKEAEEY